MMLRATEMALATEGILLRDGPPGPIGTDSRRVAQGSWFLCLRGDRFDGHDFLPHAAAAGCAGAIGETMPADWTAGFIQVPDGLLALQDLARWVRAGFGGPVIGITGSAGKTTTRAMVALALDALGPIHQTQGNLNNHIGLPLSILSAPVEASAWVLEMGMNHQGEIAVLQDIAQPTVRLITNVGPAHIEGCGSIEGVALAKGELFLGARPGDICCINVDDARVRTLPIPAGVRLLRYGSRLDSNSEARCNDAQIECDVLLTAAAIDPVTLHTRFHVETPRGNVRGAVRTPGLHLAMNATAAIAIAEALRLDLAPLSASLSAFEPVGMRNRIEEGPRGLRIINDAYNANPISMRASLLTLAAVAGARRVALLGDMLELGEEEAPAHREVLEHARGLGFSLLGVAGPRFAAAAAGADDVLVAPDADRLALLVAERLTPGDVVLLKGSRGMAMERVLHHLGATAPASESR
jgi:UDP-N-acetylmuramoyl-tripeptide--D-alanyl-D-alanine ligase